MDKKELDKILEDHRKWTYGDPDGKQAVLRYEDLKNVDFEGYNLEYADLTGSNLRGADLWGVNLRGADLRDADLRDTDLRYAIISDADLRGADLRDAMLENADTDEMKTDAYTKTNWPMVCPENCSFIGWKKAFEYDGRSRIRTVIIKLEIPADAERTSATTKICRASKAKVLEIQNKDGTKADLTEVKSARGGIYKLGEMVYPDEWDPNRWNEGSHGIHFFMTRRDCELYIGN